MPVHGTFYFAVGLTVHLVSHLQMIYDVMACARGHERDCFLFFFFFQKLPNVTIQFFKSIYVRIPRLDHTFSLSEVLHKVHT